MSLKYLPWQGDQWSQLGNAITSKRVPHALQLAGRTGLGLEHFAGCFAAKLLCRGEEDSACGVCKSCVLFLSGNHPDVFRAEPEEAGKQIKVDTIRELISFIQLKSQYGRYKIAIIHPAEAMNRNAANALLKTLEEPPADSVLILITHKLAALPITVRSRCLKLDFSPSLHPSTAKWLQQTTGCTIEQAADLLYLSSGRPLYAESMLDGDIIEKRNIVLKDLQLSLERPADTVRIAEKWYEIGHIEVFQWLISYLSIMAKLKLDRSGGGVSVQVEDLQRLANALDLTQLLKCHELAIRNYRAATGPYNLNGIGLLEEFIVYWQSQRL